MEIGKIDLKQLAENMKALRETDPETMDKIVASTMKAMTSDPDFMQSLINMVKGATPDEPKSE